jgi:hypothetical protein
MNGTERRLYLSLFCRGLLQGVQKNADVVVQQLDRIAGALPEVLSAGHRLSIPGAGLWLSFMDSLSHQLDRVLQRSEIHDNTFCPHSKERYGAP